MSPLGYEPMIVAPEAEHGGDDVADERLTPVVAAAVDRAEVRPGTRLLDLASATGHATVLAAYRGAIVTRVGSIGPWVGVDGPGAGTLVPSAVVTEVLDDGRSISSRYDAVLSVFGIAEGPEAPAAVRAVAGALAYRGLFVATFWSPGSFVRQALAAADAMLRERGEPSLAPPDPDALHRAVAGAGFASSTERRGVRLGFATAEDAVDGWLATVPQLQRRRLRLERSGAWRELRRRLRAVVAEHDEVERGVAVSLSYDLLAAALIDPRRATAGGPSTGR